jgi:cytochrome P450
LWGDPKNFRPERFIENPKADVFVFSTGNLRFILDVFDMRRIFFFAGKRVCPGESFARNELFLYVCGLLQAFRFELDPNFPKPSLDPMKAAVLRQHEAKLILRQRKIL